MGAWDKYDSTKTNKKSAWDKYDKSQQTGPSFKERLTGAPTQQKNGTYTANTGILPFLTEIPRTFVQFTEAVGNTLGQSTAVNSGALDNLNKANEQRSNIELDIVKRALQNKKEGKDNTRLVGALNSLPGMETQESIAPKSMISNRQAVGELIGMGTEMIGFGNIGNVTKAVAGKAAMESFKRFTASMAKEQLAKLSSKQIINNWLKDTGFNIAQGYGYDVGSKLQNDIKGLEAFKPGLGTALAAVFSVGIGGASAASAQNANSAARIAEKQAQTFNIPEAGTPPVGYFKALPERATPPRSPAIELPEPGILKAGEDIRNPKPTILPETPKSPIVKRAESFNSRQDFINSERTAINRSKEINKGKFTKGVISEIPTTTDNQLGKIWDEAHATPKQTGTPPIPRQVIDQPTTQPLASQESVLPSKVQTEAPSVESPVQPKAKFIPEEKQKIIDESSESYKNKESYLGNSETDLPYIKAQAKIATDIAESDPARARRIALGQELPPDGAKADAFHSVMVNLARKNKDNELLYELINSDGSGTNISKETARALNLGKIKEPDNPYYVIKDIEYNRAKKISKFEKEKISTQDKIYKRQLDEEIKRTIPTVEDIKSIARTLFC